MASPVWAFALALGLAVVHLYARTVCQLRTVPRSLWLSAAGGVSVAYVFVHLLPEVASRQSRVLSEGQPPGVMVTYAREQLLFVAVLVGFVLFYGLERAVRCSAGTPGSDDVAGGAQSRTTAGVFWLHVSSFALFNALIGYLLLHREETGLGSLLLFGTAMGLHFVVNDQGLYEHHRDAYAHRGRWLLAGAILAGFAVGYATEIPHTYVSFLLAFLAGGVVLNVIKEELPAERESRFWAFSAGVGVYTVILLLV